MGKFKKTITEDDVLRHALKKSGGIAYNTTLSEGISVTVLAGNNIQRIQPDGKKITIGRISPNIKKSLPSKIRLK